MKKFICLAVLASAAIIMYIAIYFCGGKPTIAQRVEIKDYEQKAKVNQFLEEAINDYNKTDGKSFKKFWADVPAEKYSSNMKNLSAPPLASPNIEKLTQPKIGMGTLFVYVSFPGQEKNTKFVLQDLDDKFLIKGIYPSRLQ